MVKGQSKRAASKAAKKRRALDLDIDDPIAEKAAMEHQKKRRLAQEETIKIEPGRTATVYEVAPASDTLAIADKTTDLPGTVRSYFAFIANHDPEQGPFDSMVNMLFASDEIKKVDSPQGFENWARAEFRTHITDSATIDAKMEILKPEWCKRLGRPKKIELAIAMLCDGEEPLPENSISKLRSVMMDALENSTEERTSSWQPRSVNPTGRPQNSTTDSYRPHNVNTNGNQHSRPYHPKHSSPPRGRSHPPSHYNGNRQGPR